MENRLVLAIALTTISCLELLCTTIDPIKQELSVGHFVDEELVLGADTLSEIEDDAEDYIRISDSSLFFSRGDLSFAVRCAARLGQPCAGKKSDEGFIPSGGYGTTPFVMCTVSVVPIQFNSGANSYLSAPCGGGQLVDSSAFRITCIWAEDSSYSGTVYAKTYVVACGD